VTDQPTASPAGPDIDIRAVLERAAASIQRLTTTTSQPWSAFTDRPHDSDRAELAQLLVEQARAMRTPLPTTGTEPAEAISAVVRAWTWRGVTPGRNATAAEDVRQAMPELADALDHLAAAHPDSCDLGWRPIEP
jgi:hypothetical protein